MSVKFRGLCCGLQPPLLVGDALSLVLGRLVAVGGPQRSVEEVRKLAYEE